MRKVLVFCLVALSASGCAERYLEPSPNDPRHLNTGTGGTPATTGSIGGPAGLGTGTNTPSDTAAATSEATRAPEISVTGDGASVTPVGEAASPR